VACGSDPAAKKPGVSGPNNVRAAAGATTGGGGTDSGGSAAARSRGHDVNGLTLARRHPGRGGLHRLTTSELQHSLQDLLGDGIPLKDVDPRQHRRRSFASIGARVVTRTGRSELGTRPRMRAATDTCSPIRRDLAQVVCVPSGATDTACLNSLTAFGRRAFRRPLTDAE